MSARHDSFVRLKKLIKTSYAYVVCYVINCIQIIIRDDVERSSKKIQLHKFHNLFRMNNSFEVFTESQKVIKQFVKFEIMEYHNRNYGQFRSTH